MLGKTFTSLHRRIQNYKSTVLVALAGFFFKIWIISKSIKTPQLWFDPCALAMFSCLAFLKAARNFAWSLPDSEERSLSIYTVGKRALFSYSFLLNHTESQSIRDRKRANIGRGQGGLCIFNVFDVDSIFVPPSGFPVRWTAWNLTSGGAPSSVKTYFRFWKHSSFVSFGSGIL